jgi:Zn-dependent protease with chaperone function
MKRVLAVLLALVLIGCAAPVTKRMQVNDVAAEIEAKKQREIALQTVVGDQLRLFRVSHPISTKASGLCPASKFVTGAVIVNNVSFGNAYKEAMGSVYGVTDVLKVFYVEPGSPSDMAGLKMGDLPVSVNGWTVPVGDKANEAFSAKMETTLKDGKPLEVTVLRGDVRQVLNIQPIKACAYSVQLTQDDIINAFADGEKVMITKGMMRFAKDDVELSLVVGHELAHNAMKHMSAKKTNYVIGSIFDVVAAAYGVNTQGLFGNAAAQAYSQDFEAEADYVGLYMIAVAGLNIENAPQFWRRMAADHPGSIATNHAASHPATPHRFLALEDAVKEIKGKMASGSPLVPEMKKN